MTLGRQDQRVFVNSAESLSREKVDERFPNAQADGSIPWALVVREVGSDAIVGRVAIREEFRELYAAQIRRPVGPMRALQLLRGYPYDDWHGVAVTRQSTLQQWAQDKAHIRTHGIELRTGSLTDPASGSNC